MTALPFVAHALTTRPGAPWLLDLFCGAGGAAMGYWQAGFNVLGVDIAPQPHFPFWFVQADALEFAAQYGREFDAIHASPPCQRFSTMTHRWQRQNEHPDLIAPLRHVLQNLEVPYVIENVPGAPLQNPILLCGSMFNLQVRKHRSFESSILLFQQICQHHLQTQVIGVYGHPGGTSKRDNRIFGTSDMWKRAMKIEWMNNAELAQAIPPAYTRYIGAQLMRVVRPQAAAVR